MSFQQLQTSSNPLNDTDWSNFLQDNKEAQDLLSNAIAHHQSQYLPENDLNKRTISHLHHKSDHYNADPKASTESYDDSVQYSEGELSSDETSAQNDGKPAPKKAGRKPLTTEPATKRKAQNRAAQRAFRERKERYVKTLEDRIKELEEMQPQPDTTLAEENQNLKVLVQKLETENYFLKERSFTFDFPISQPGLYSAAKSRQDAAAQAQTVVQKSPQSDIVNNNTLKQTNVTSGANPKMNGIIGAKHIANDILPWTPPSSGGDSVPNSPLSNDLAVSEHDSHSQISYTDNVGVVPKFRNTTPEAAGLFSSLIDEISSVYNSPGLSVIGSDTNSIIGTNIDNISSINTITSTMSTPNINQNIHLSLFGNQGLGSNQLSTGGSNLDGFSPSSSFALFSDNSPSPLTEELVHSPTPISLFESDQVGHPRYTHPATSSLSVPSFTYEQTQALFTDFRDPSDPRDFFTNFDEAVDSQFPDHPIADILNNQLLDYADTKAGVPKVPSQTKVVDHFAGACDGTNPKALPPLAENENAIPYSQAWDQIAKHPNFDDSDIDVLCSELKSKAKCSGHGPAVPQSAIDTLIIKLNQE
ncbi:hypothetical protein BGZ76_010071 [Entomortierella beljakovae]|nr:hypothetical protein BGZ76_010071 [Entomortierella beljakovae]